jgi:hypothetical protein
MHDTIRVGTVDQSVGVTKFVMRLFLESFAEENGVRRETVPLIL